MFQPRHCQECAEQMGRPILPVDETHLWKLASPEPAVLVLRFAATARLGSLVMSGLEDSTGREQDVAARLESHGSCLLNDEVEFPCSSVALLAGILKVLPSTGLETFYLPLPLSECIIPDDPSALRGSLGDADRSNSFNGGFESANIQDRQFTVQVD